MNVKVAIVDSFVDGDKGGNPAGVVLDADGLTANQKLEIAQKVGLSETAFVSQSDSADFKTDFFTPQQQIAHCGHATIATFSHLSQLGLVKERHTSKETIDGKRDIEVIGDFAYMSQRQPNYIEVESDIEAIYRSLGLKDSKLISTPKVVNTGNSFLVIGVESKQTLESLTVDQALVHELSDKYDLIGFYVFTLDTNRNGRDASTRMFAPRYGITEESATGMAAGPLACYLHDYMGIDKETLLIEQGYSMSPASPSVIEVVLTTLDGNITSLKAGGVGKPSRYMDIEI